MKGTAAGMSAEKIHPITELIRRESTGSPRPAASTSPRRTESSPLGLPSWSDKLIGEVVRPHIAAYYKP
jgi:hypothetical protein